MKVHRKLLSMHLATGHFCFLLEDRSLAHKTLTFATSKVTELWSVRQQHHLVAISEFTTYSMRLGSPTLLLMVSSECLSVNMHLGIDFQATLLTIPLVPTPSPLGLQIWASSLWCRKAALHSSAASPQATPALSYQCPAANEFIYSDNSF